MSSGGVNGLGGDGDLISREGFLTDFKAADTLLPRA